MPEEKKKLPTLSEGVLVAGGRYKVLRLLGQGGFGEVYLCEIVATSHKAVLKILKRENAVDTTLVERFLREPRAASAVNSEHIVNVFDAGHDDDLNLYYLTMEFLQGHDLFLEITAFGERLSEIHALTVVRQVLDALEATHEARVIHRDLKPENVFITRDKHGRIKVKLLDFGIAQMEAADRMTKTTTTIGSPLYMALEQFRDPRGVDQRVDIYSLGVMMYEMFTGTTPFQGDNIGAVIASAMEHNVPPIPWINPVLFSLILKAMGKTPAERFQSAREMGEAIDAYATTVKGMDITGGVRFPLPQPPEAEKPTTPVEGAGYGAVTPPSAPPQPGAVAAARMPTVSEGVSKDTLQEEKRSDRRKVAAAVGMIVIAVVVSATILLVSMAPKPQPPSPTTAALDRPLPTPVPVTMVTQAEDAGTRDDRALPTPVVAARDAGVVRPATPIRPVTTPVRPPCQRHCEETVNGPHCTRHWPPGCRR